MKKIAGFVSELSSHAVYAEPQLSTEFEQETGHKAPWPKNTVGRTNTTLGHFKGLEHEIKGNESLLCSYGWEIASACEEEFAKTNEWAKYMGRGSSFRAAVESLEKARV